MRTHKKMFVIVGLIAMSIGVIGCGESANENTEMGKTEGTVKSKATETDNTIETETETDNHTNTKKPSDEKAVTADSLITKAGGLGDTKEAMEQLRGADVNEEDAGISSYQNNALLVMYAEDDVTKKNTANNVTLSFEATDSPRRSVEEALQEASSVIPSDAVKVKQYTVDEGRDVIQYESKLLAERLKGYYDFNATLDPESKPGTFIIILKHDDKGTYSVVIGVGDNP